jgi:hypothetical protein
LERVEFRDIQHVERRKLLARSKTMSHACIGDAFAPAEALYRAAVMADTWGHLAPMKNRTYRGHIVFAVGCLGSDDLNPTCLEFELKTRGGDDLDSSPWFFDALEDFMQSFETEAGGVYRWDGTFRNYTFAGTLTRMKLTDSEAAPVHSEHKAFE